MLSRRTFLQTAVLGLSLPAGNGLCATETAPARARVLTDPACADGRLFHRSLPLQAQCLDVDAGAYLETVATDLGGGRCSFLLGLTRNSDFILLRQTAFEHGYRMIYRGEHHYGGDGIHHVLSADAAIVRELGEALAAGTFHWPRALAGAVPVLARSGATATTATVHAAARRPADSRGFLLSWAFARQGPA